MKKFSRRAFIIDLFTLTAGTFLLDAFWLEKFFIETREFYLNGATPEGRNIKLVQISDLHLQSISLQHKLLAERINKLNPDLILFTGDSIDRRKRQDLFDKYMGLFKHEIKKVAILGNREYKGGVDLEILKDIYIRHNCDLLVNESAKYQLGSGTISITGIDDFIAGDADFLKAMETYSPADHHVVLTHCPQHRDIILEQMGNTPIDCVLSGHTHGGQVKILGYVPYKPEGSGNYLQGWYNESQPHLYVSKGIGTTALPIRFGARAEIAVFHLPQKSIS